MRARKFFSIQISFAKSEEAERRRASLSPLSLLESEIKFFQRESERAIPFTTTTTKIRLKLPIENKKEESRRFCLSARARVFARASSEMRSLLYYTHLFPF